MKKNLLIALTISSTLIYGAPSADRAYSEHVIVHKSQIKKEVEAISKTLPKNTKLFQEIKAEKGDNLYTLIKKNGFNPDDTDLMKKVLRYNSLNLVTAKRIPIGQNIIIPMEEKVVDTIKTSQAATSSYNAVPFSLARKEKSWNSNAFIGTRRYGLTNEGETKDNNISDFFAGASLKKNKLAITLMKDGLLEKAEDEFHHDKTELRLGYDFYSNKYLKNLTILGSRAINRYNVTQLNLNNDLSEVRTDLTSMGLGLEFYLPSDRFGLKVNILTPFITSGASSSKTFGKTLNVENRIYIESIASYKIEKDFDAFLIISRQQDDVTFTKTGASLGMDTITGKIGAQLSF